MPSLSKRDDASLALSAPAILICAGALSGWTLVLADSLARTGFAYFSIARHFAAAFALYSAVGALLGVLAWALTSIEWRLLGRALDAREGSPRWARPLAYGALAALSSASTARWVFRGARIAKSSAASWGPFVFAFAVGGATAVGVSLVLEAKRALARGELRRFWSSLLALAGAALALIYVDLCCYVALYARIHTILELGAALTLGAAFALALALTNLRSRGAARGTRMVASVLAAWLVAGLCSQRVRAWLDGALTPVWLDEVYIGRVLRRVQIAEAFFKDPWHWPGLAMSRIDRVRDRYPLGDSTLAAEWQTPLQEPAGLTREIATLRGERRGYSVIVFYVDTLRNDVARDAHTMPNLAQFARESLDFTSAYAAGSDTLRSLPALTGGNYDVSNTPPNDLLRVAARARYKRELVIPDSAHGFLDKLRPDFRFDHTTRILDHQPGLEVWGYGADQTTAKRIVDAGAQFLNGVRHDTQPFFLWLFNFDQHNWRELDRAYVARTAAAHGIDLNAGGLTAHYRAVAAGIDDAFGRMLHEIDARGLRDSTIVLFVSDHGESLGRNGFWMHSVFLWDELVRVPLMLRVPGMPAAHIASRVSLVDVAPTLARYMQAEPDLSGYQGEDLLGNLVGEPHRRRLPILLTASSKDLLVRVGLIDPDGDFKLVLPFEAALPELFDLSSAHGELMNTADDHPQKTLELLHQLARSPVFPRAADDFDVRETKQQKAQPHPREPD